MTPRFALKAATAQAHERLDARFSRLDLAVRDDYIAFLRAQAGALVPVEAALDAAGAERVVEDWLTRRRSGALLADLEQLGAIAPAAVPAPTLRSQTALLGAIYVLEGSRLGGAVLARTVPDTLPRRFLAPGNPDAWRAFVRKLDEQLSSQADIEDAARAANAVFETFSSAASNILGPTVRD